MQFDEGAHDRQAEADAAMARIERMAFETPEHLVEQFRRDAAPAIGHLEHDLVLPAQGGERDGLARLGKADGVGKQVEQDLPHALAVGAERADVGAGDDGQLDMGFGQPVLHAFGGFMDGALDVDVAELQFHRVAVDRRQIENVVDDGEQSGGGFQHVAGIFLLLVVERADAVVAEQLDEADDVGERRAQLVGHVMDEVVAQLLGGEQGLVAFLQGALDIHAVGDVDEGQQRAAVGKRRGGAIDDGAVGAAHAARETHADRMKPRDHAAQVRPGRLVGQQRLAGRRRYCRCEAAPRACSREGARCARTPDCTV